jgi:acyl-CoA dehydrogenase
VDTGLGHLSFGLFRGPVSDSEAELYAAECMIADACRRDAGYLAEYEAERFFRDSRVFRIYEGTAQILQLFIAKSMLRQFATEN